MNLWGLIPLFIGLLLLGVGIFFVVKYWGKVSYKMYSGKVVFESHGDYGKFKRVIGDKGVISFSADVLSSEPPIVVEYSLTTTPDFEFPFESKERIESKLGDFQFHIGAFIAGGLIGLLGLLMLLGIA